ncbi:MAG: CtsR family transcriptional regulator [Oscillospiraceae bacterium]|nr:CtsR family transcriptional regulator [Oscillospiraceae bacterium]
MGISDRIEAFILELMKQEEAEQLRIQRNELAQLFGCVPSQINYVISTRFSPERGYAVESRRGGGGYVTIRRLPQERVRIYTADTATVEQAEQLIAQLSDMRVIDKRIADVMRAAVLADIFKEAQGADKLRAGILKSMLKAL